ncbi:uncharacterized protein LOC103574885 [Microplitis demolitor]|uniref:uncharacterized protein LOC103574885 n=1 Tax=Microplitis demolitor TaxID=69319 RepID=UPI00043FFFC4|nr:uncharacterized protein LOC103574885 [Microplitis demolitor]
MLNFSQFGCGKIAYKLLTEDNVESALEIQQKSMCDENVAIGVGLFEEEGAPESMKFVFREVIKDNCTVVAVDTETDEVVAVSFNKLHVQSKDNEIDFLEKVIQNHVKKHSALALIQFLDDAESKINIFEKYDVSAAMEIFYIGTDPNYRGRRIGQEILGASLALANDLKNPKNESKVKPEAVFGVFTSNYSQRLAECYNFDWLWTASYSDYEYFGKKMSARINNEHKTAKFGARRL